MYVQKILKFFLNLYLKGISYFIICFQNEDVLDQVEKKMEYDVFHTKLCEYVGILMRLPQIMRGLIFFLKNLPDLKIESRCTGSTIINTTI